MPFYIYDVLKSSNFKRFCKNFQSKGEAIPDNAIPKETEEIGKKTAKNQDYILSEKITRRVDNFGVCADILKEAK